MCGIIGVVDRKLDSDQLLSMGSSMADSLHHRGPDDSGLWLDEKTSLVLGHRRLAVHDLSPHGAQPMKSRSGRFVIVFNGEIYNFKSIAKMLHAEGYTFRGKSDTEVLVNAIEHWGIESTLKQCIGMFAFAIYDTENKTLTLARDRVGEKPLYFACINQRFLFASELKGIASILRSERPEIDMSALASYLRYGYISAPDSIYKNVKKLEPGSILIVDLNNTLIDSNLLKSRTYWSVDQLFCNESQIDNATIATKELDETINLVIGEQAISDVPLGAFLSGGIDSSIVASVLQSQKDVPIDTFTIGFNERAFNEADHAKRIASHIGSSHHELYLSSHDVLNVVPELSQIYDEPFADSSQIPMVIVSRLARKTVTVCLSGDGGDELFCGYNRYTRTQNMVDKSAAIPGPVKGLISRSLTSISPGTWDFLYSSVKDLLRKKGGANFGAKMHKLGHLIDTRSYQSAYEFLCSYWNNPEKVLLNYEVEKPLGTLNDFQKNFLSSAMEWDQRWYLPGDNLVKTDRASMSTSLEMRVPLLDLRIIDLSWRISNNLKFTNGQSKWVLRQVLYKYVPEALIERPKMGFTIPIGRWLRNELREWAEALISHDFIHSQGIFNADVIHRAWREHLSERYDHSNKLWTILIFQDWYITQTNLTKKNSVHSFDGFDAQ